MDKEKNALKPRYFLVDGVWISIGELEKLIGVSRKRISSWIYNHTFDINIKKYLNCIPKIEQDPNKMINDKGKRWYIIYKVDMEEYQIGIDVGYGDNADIAIKEFLKSRKKSIYKFKVIEIHHNRHYIYEKYNSFLRLLYN